MKFLLLVSCLVVYGAATQVRQCPNIEKPIEDLQDRIQIGNCNKPPCRFRKDTVVQAEFKFKPEKDIGQLTNTVFAKIVGVPFPFVGVDGMDACKDVYQADGVTKVDGCKLKAGQEYVFKSGIEVLQIYPRIKTEVHWALTGPDKDVICFELPARITN